MSNTFKCNIGEGDAEVEVEYKYFQGDDGSYYQPPEPDSVEIQTIMYKEVDITDCLDISVIEYLEEKAMQDMSEQYTAMMDARAEAEYENRKLEQHYGY